MVGVIVVGSLVDVHRHEFRIEMWSLKGAAWRICCEESPELLNSFKPISRLSTAIQN